MPVFCPHCHKMVAEQPTCGNCGKSLRAAAPLGSSEPDRAAMRLLIRDALGWVLAFCGGIFLCLLLLWWLLS